MEIRDIGEKIAIISRRLKNIKVIGDKLSEDINNIIKEHRNISKVNFSDDQKIC